jgi:hydrogenase maturation protease
VRILIAGFGNELRGDDGFGVKVVRELERVGFAAGRPDVEIVEIGTAGVSLVQKLFAGYDRLIVVDAMKRNAPPGAVHVLRVESVPPAGEIDLHLAVPARALALASSLGALPPDVFLVGCEPLEVDELTTELSPAVRDAVRTAVEQVARLVEGRSEEMPR